MERVAIIGGGLAGLSAAAELVTRGYEVTVIEAGERCGGKLAAWRDADGDPLEHGIHGWWPNYVNFFDLMKRAGVAGGALQKSDGSMGVFPDATTFSMKPLLIRLPSPIFLAAHFLKSPVRGVVDIVSVLRAGLGILAFRARDDFARLDRYTFRSWLWRKGVSQRMYDVFFEPYIRSFAFDSSMRISAAAALSSFHLYLVRHQDALIVNWLTDDPDTLITRPLIQYIEKHGGRVITGVRVQGLVQSAEGRISALQTSQPIAPSTAHREPKGTDVITRIDQGAIPDHGSLSVSTEHGKTVEISRTSEGVVAALKNADGSAPSTPLHVDLTATAAILRNPESPLVGSEIARVDLATVPARGFLAVPHDPPLFVGRNAAGDFAAFSSVCTHMGCTVAWKSPVEKFLCPCHGAEFGFDGQAVAGPAGRPLDHYATQVEGSALIIREIHTTVPTLEIDHVVMAVDVEASKRLISERMRDHLTFRKIDSLTTTPVIVVRMWFDGRNLLGNRTSGVFIDYPLLDNFFVLSNLQKSFAGRDETVLEVQIYRVDDEIELGDERLLELVLADLRRAFPAFARPPRKHFIQRHGAVFPLHEAGAEANRPETRTPIGNLYMAGDWIGRDSEVWNMERAVATGRQAAAAVMEDTGAIGPEVLVAPLGGWLFRTCVAVLRGIGNAWGWLGRQVRGDRFMPPRPIRADSLKRALGNSNIQFSIYKFRGKPNEQVVVGKFRVVAGSLVLAKTGAGWSLGGRFDVDLEAFDSGNILRDYNVRTFVFCTTRNPLAHFEITGAALPNWDAPEDGIGVEFTSACEGLLTLNGQKQKLAFRVCAKVLEGGMISARTESNLVLCPGDYGLNVAALLKCCGAVVEDRVELGLRITSPYAVSRITDSKPDASPG